MPQENPAYTDEEKASFRDEPDHLTTLHANLAEAFGIFANAVVDSSSAEIKMIEDACLANLEDNVRDPELREALRPTYRAACKRLIISPNFYDAIQQPNAELVTDSIVRVEPGRRADGATAGCTSSTCSCWPPDSRPTRSCDRCGSRAAPARRSTRRGQPRPVAYLSVSIPDFPNFFMLNGPNGPVGQLLADRGRGAAVRYIMQLIERLRSDECREISASREATDALEAERTKAAEKTVWVTGCKSWYLDDRGIPAVWPWSFERFRTEMRAPNLEHFALR